MSGLILTDIEFRRVMLHLRGRFSDEMSGGLRETGTIRFYFESPYLDRYEPQQTLVDLPSGSFELIFHIMGMDHRYPLRTGEYRLKAETPDGKVWQTYLSEDLHHANEFGRIVLPEQEQASFRRLRDSEQDNPYSFWYRNTSLRHGDESYQILSMIDPDRDTYYIQVLTEYVREDLGIRRTFRNWASETAIRLRDLFKPFKESLTVRYFNRCQEKRKRSGTKTILFASGSRMELGGNLGFVHDRMEERGLLSQYRVLYNFKASAKKRRGIRGTLSFTRKLAESDIILIDDFLPFMYKFDFPEDVKIVQLWHACGAFKAVGFERIGKSGVPALNSRAHKCYTHMPVSSELVAHHYAEAFVLPEEILMPIGVPRTDIFFDEDYRKKITASLHEQYPILNERNKVILYAPTFRGDGALSAYFPYEVFDLERLGAWCREHNDLLILKMHPFVKQRFSIPEEYSGYFIDLSSHREINDLLFVTDVLITDYSSVMYEFSLLRRPIYFYAFDQKLYERTRDFYEPFEQTVPGGIVKTMDELIAALENDTFDYSGLDAFIARNFKYTDGRSTDRVIDQIILE
ncbi:MAG: CDP-glycerol glycerophosphotransferase family protein [Mogibacterium sp.]|nr:CDP-glycerol glycerophosphotransferase family protein [Mogibacterium sp.]